MYEIIKAVINNKRYELSDILKKIDTLWVQGDLTDENKAELVALAQNGADPSKSVDVLAKLAELDMKIKALEEKLAENTPEEPIEAIEDYVAGRWYRTGAKVRFDGKAYVCTAPENVVCVWSPADYPAYWSEIAEG